MKALSFISKRKFMIYKIDKKNMFNSLRSFINSKINKLLLIDENAEDIVKSVDEIHKKNLDLIKNKNISNDSKKSKTNDNELLVERPMIIEALNLEELENIHKLDTRLKELSGDNYVMKGDDINILSFWEKIEIYEVNDKGEVSLPHLKNEANFKNLFNNIDEYTKFKNDFLKNVKETIKQKLTPMEYNITQNQGTEPEFTGIYCNHEEVGVYSCKVCTQNLFSNTQKYKCDAGWATFWNFLPFSINLKKDFLNKFQYRSRQGILPLHHDNLETPEFRLSCSNVRVNLLKV